jgi:myo-inositol-1(or 4)-monophosphatase
MLAEVLRDAAPLARNDLKRLDPSQVVNKAAHDYQTSADRNVDLCLAEKLREASPNWRIVGEGFGAQGAFDAEAPMLVIDPIDGTTNYAWGFPNFGMMITLV